MIGGLLWTMILTIKLIFLLPTISHHIPHPFLAITVCWHQRWFSMATFFFHHCTPKTPPPLAIGVWIGPFPPQHMFYVTSPLSVKPKHDSRRLLAFPSWLSHHCFVVKVILHLDIASLHHKPKCHTLRLRVFLLKANEYGFER